MVKIFTILSLSTIGIFLCHKIFIWLENKGWLYYRDRKPQSGIIGETLQELNSILQPSTRHVIEAKQNKAQSKRNCNDENSNLKNDYRPK